MLFIFIFTILASSLAAVVPISQLSPDPTDGDDCPIFKERKILTWDFLSTIDTSEPHLINRYDLVAPGAGFVWRGEAYYYPDVTRPILFQRGQGWSLVNCSSYFARDDPARNGCTSPDFALLSSPNTKTGDAPPEKGKIGTIHGLKYPEPSIWAVYDLVEFSLTAIIPPKYYEELTTIEVFGWREDGTITTSLRFKKKGSEVVGYKVELPKGEWDGIVQWQVRVWWSAGSRLTRENFKYLIDDVVVDEYALGSNYYSCRYPLQTPTGPPGPVVTLGFDDIPVTPNTSVLPPVPYHDYIFDQGFGTWKVVNQFSYPAGSPGRLTSAFTEPNALLGSPRISGRWSHDPNVITTPDFLWDVESFHISIDNTTTSTNDTRDIMVIINAVGTCYPDFLNLYDDATSTLVEAHSYSFDIDLAQKGFTRYRSVSIYVMDYGIFQYIPFWIDNIKVRSWKGSLELPGCERCGTDLNSWCQYPPLDRPVLGGGED